MVNRSRLEHRTRRHGAPAPTSARQPSGLFRLLTLLALLALLLCAHGASAAPEAHILRIDPRASLEGGEPLLTTVIELVQHKRMSSGTANCAQRTGNANFDCLADEIEKPQALYAPFKFPEKNALLTVAVDGADRPATLVSAGDGWQLAALQTTRLS